MTIEYIHLFCGSQAFPSQEVFIILKNFLLSTEILLSITLFMQLSIICPKLKTGNSETNLGS